MFLLGHFFQVSNLEGMAGVGKHFWRSLIPLPPQSRLCWSRLLRTVSCQVLTPVTKMGSEQSPRTTWSVFDHFYIIGSFYCLKEFLLFQFLLTSLIKACLYFLLLSKYYMKHYRFFEQIDLDNYSFSF